MQNFHGATRRRVTYMSNSDIVFCGTYSRGLENFVEDYLLKNESLLIIDHTFEGRVYFRYSASYDRNSLQKLKYFERLFFNVHYESIRRRVLTKSEHLGLIKNTFVKRLDDLKRLIHILLSLKSKSIVDDNDVGFRISCKINGRMKNRIDSKRLSQELSIILRKSMHLIANLKRPDVEVSLKLNDEGFFIGLPVFELLDRGGRAIFLTARNLRQTLASAAEKAYDSKKKFAVSQYYDVSLGTNEACIVLFNVVYE
uniref:THUMP domain-containing protein n=1 Tax=Romanomermis culicivorax TaxID=13658 RepID=A0A915KAP4_ROMCU